jgi:hypothetical protein
MQMGEPDATDSFVVNDQHFILGHFKYLQMTLWKWSGQTSSYIKAGRHRFSTNGENNLVLTRMQLSVFESQPALITNVGNHNIYHFALNLEDLAVSRKLKLHHKSKSTLLDFA